jgi:hypothetical protein
VSLGDEEGVAVLLPFPRPGHFMSKSMNAFLGTQLPHFGYQQSKPCNHHNLIQAPTLEAGTASGRDGFQAPPALIRLLAALRTV